MDCYWLFPPSLFKGVRLLQSASSKREEARRLEAEAQQLETEGWGKLREAIMGSEVEGFYGLLRGVTLPSHPLPSQPPPSRTHLSPSSPAFQQTPQESTGPGSLRSRRPCHHAHPSRCNSSYWGQHSGGYATPSYSVGGAKRVYQCWVEGCKECPSTSRVAICAHIRRAHLGMGLVCPLCSKSFFNLDVFRHHKKTHQ